MRNALIRTAVALGPASRGRHRRATPLDTHMARGLAATLGLAGVAALVLGALAGGA